MLYIKLTSQGEAAGWTVMVFVKHIFYFIPSGVVGDSGILEIILENRLGETERSGAGKAEPAMGQ